jgi:hypothetical protein
MDLMNDHEARRARRRHRLAEIAATYTVARAPHDQTQEIADLKLELQNKQEEADTFQSVLVDTVRDLAELKHIVKAMTSLSNQPTTVPSAPNAKDFEDIPLSDALPVMGRPVPSAPILDNKSEDIDDALGWLSKWRLTSSKKDFKAQLSKVCDLEDKMDYEEKTHRLAGTTDQVGTDKRRREYDAEKLKLSDLRMACINLHKKYVPHLTMDEIECKMHA